MNHFVKHIIAGGKHVDIWKKHNLYILIHGYILKVEYICILLTCLYFNIALAGHTQILGVSCESFETHDTGRRLEGTTRN